MSRKGKRSKKLRGSSHGKGNTKNQRGSGNKGGVGHAGSFGHKFSQMLKYYPEQFDVKGFTRPGAKKTLHVNVFQIGNMAKKGQLPQKDGKYSFEFKGKVLGDGEISVPVLVKANSASKSAVEKIKKAGGSLELSSPSS